MSLSPGPVIFIEDDSEDHEFMLEAYRSLNLRHGWKLFPTAKEALHYFRTTTDKPFIIISEINLRGMDGIELRKTILQDDLLRKKSIPFVFFTTNYDLKDVENAYDLEVQGYFIKKYSIPDTARMLQKIIDYWTECYHPNNAR